MKENPKIAFRVFYFVPPDAEEKMKKVSVHRVITNLGREEIDFLDKLGKDALFSTGHKLSYNDILRGLIDFAMETGISGEDLGSGEELKKRLLQQLANSSKAHR